ncbi:alpha-2-macroglobulin [Prevotella sp. 10(H)]|uniref:alpha-2-macroglobulin family protein n=1 Tax=Prevotella sp. 10(H) TaxID=1158294 RepID=UPI0004A74AB4|nr:alpha-2-macroglobulin family protein [Prevotella sp. 10(H)]
MKKNLLISLFLLLSISMIAQTSNNKYEGEWKKVEDFDNQSLPQSSAQIVEEILQKAIADKNNTQVIKALIYKNKYKIQIDIEDKEGLLTDLQALVSQSDKAEEKALLHSMLAELYSNYFNRNQWQINQRTNLSDVVPQDIKEWSTNIFKDKIIENLDLSVKDVATLKQHTTKEYDDIILLGTDGQKYYPTLYDFLMERTIGIAQMIEGMGYREYDTSSTGASLEQLIAPADEYIKLNINAGTDRRHIIYIYYQQYMKDLLARNMTPTLIFTEIDKVKYMSRNSRTFSGDVVRDAYIALEKKYENSEYSTEIIKKIIDSYYSRPSTYITEDIYKWIQKGISKYPDSFGGKILKGKLVEMQNPFLQIIGDQLQYPENPVKLTLFHKNLQVLEDKPVFKLYKIENGNYNPVKDFALDLVSQVPYRTDTLLLDLGTFTFGKYAFSSLTKDQLEKRKNGDDIGTERNNTFEFAVSDLIAFSRNSAKDEYEIFVTDRMSGKPVKNASVKIFSFVRPGTDEVSALLTTLKTNDLGLAIYKDKTEKTDKYRYAVATYKVEIGADTCLRAENLQPQDYRWIRQEMDTDAEDAISLFTDRSIYRPGQTAYFKAIVLDSNSKPKANEEYTVQLFNTNGEVVDEKDIITNEFGSISGEFILPQTGLLGGYRIEIDDASAYFNVEEYKRPTFEITFDKVDKTYTFGEEVRLKGYAKNFSGISLQDTEVKYQINREQFNFWSWRSGNITPFTDGMVKTNADGSFEIVFTPEAGDGNRMLLRTINDKQIYTFSVTATVTDVNGETQSNNYRLVVGNVSMVINLNIPEQIEKSGDYDLKIEARNLQMQDIETSGRYEIYSLDDNDSIKSNVIGGIFKTGKQPELMARLKTLASGKYQIQVKAADSKGNNIEEKKNFVLYSYKDKKPPIKTKEWFVIKNIIFGKDKPAEIIYGTSDKEAYVLYQLSDNKQIYERKVLRLSNENKTFTIPYKEEYGDEIKITFTSVKDGKMYQKQASLYKKTDAPDTKLNIKLEVFRDKLRPGQEETWTISVKDTTSQPVLAELLASMYDTSLDKLYPYMEWSFNRPYLNNRYVDAVTYNFPWYSRDYGQWFSFNYKVPYEKMQERTKDIINWFGYPVYNNNLIGDPLPFNLTLSEEDVVVVGYGTQRKANITGSVSRMKPESNFMIRGYSSVPTPEAAAYGVLNETMVVSSDSAAPEKGDAGGEMNTGGTAPQIRQNFNETAFFYPQLRTNEKGEVLISFTVPESNTTWRFRALAHDKDARVGTLEQFVVTRKELMVTPNMPRFVRQGDKTSISTKISNLSDNDISGDVRIEFFDPLTDKVIDLAIPNQKQTFSIEKDASTSANWTFDVPNDIELIGCRIVAQNATFSDGEQHVLAVLSNRMLVTESMPIDITKQGTSTFTFDKLYNNNSNTTENYRLTLEYASNPAWYAVQALPTMSNPSNENAVNWFASYYVNTLGSSIVRQYPKVAAMIQAWQMQGGDKQTLVSKLQKDEELKAVLLEETPWVLDAKDETEQMKRLSLLFDLNNTKQQTDAATRKLAELQTGDGGWSWYKGLYPSRSVTQYILYGYAKLQQVGQVQYPSEIKEMQMRALRYIDNQITEDFKNLKKYNKDWEKITSISTNQLEFAYVRSFYRDIPISQEARAAERFYTDVASKNWTKLNMYERSILSMVLKQNGDKDLANKIIKSIKEHAVKSPKLGMYWPNNRSNVFMSLSAISVHTFLMDALEQNGATAAEMDMMKRWLLNQKRTQVWESTHASIDAISALLSTGTDWFTTESTQAVIKVGNKTVEPQNKEMGTGYFKQAWNKQEISKDMGKVEVTTNTSQPAYGALYWQYYENLDKITEQKGDLNVSKQLFKENVSSTGKSLTQITEKNPLKIGDKVIMRLTIRVDRDMDFVQLKDMRAPCFEPIQALSGVRWAGGLIYYQTTKDASTNFYFDHLPKGTYVLEYPVYVNRSGEYANGITTIQCMYAPEFVSHTQGIKVTVKE